MSLNPPNPIIPIVPFDWVQDLDSIARLFKMSSITGDFTFNQILLVQKDVDHDAAMRNIVKTYELDHSVIDDTEDLQTINIEAVEKGQGVYNEFQGKVLSLQGTKPDPDAWMDVIDQAGEDAKQKQAEIINDAVASAKTRIEQMPPAARMDAANVFKIGMTWVGSFVQQAWNAIKDVINQITDFLKDVWNGIKNAYNTVVNAASTAIGFIKGIFSAAGYAQFEGSKPVSDVLQTVENITQTLKKQKIDMEKFSLHKVPGRRWILDGTLSSTDDGVDLSKAWKRTVHA